MQTRRLRQTTRHWTIHLISDACADDIWSATDPDIFDRDDYLTTLAELRIPGNRYNFAGANQTERFFKYASKAESKALEQSLRDGRFHCTPIPNMLNCGAYSLATYPLLLEPYRNLCDRVGAGRALSRDAYHMEAPTWTNGLVNLLACAGFRSLTKTLLHYGAPWVDVLRELPRLTKLEVAPGRNVFFMLSCGHYQEGNGAVIGVSRFAPRGFDSWQAQLEQDIIPSYIRRSQAYPLDIIALVGCYCDLLPITKTHALVKVAAINDVNKRANSYQVVNSTFAAFFDEVEEQLRAPTQSALRTVRGDTGSSWDLWPNAVQSLWSKVRQRMRDVNTLLALDAIAQPDAKRGKLLDTAIHELVALGDHAWNGNVESDMPGVKAANLAIRRRRLDALGDAVDSARRNLRRGRVATKVGRAVSVVNTLPWKRHAQVTLPAGLSLMDVQTSNVIRTHNGHVTIPDMGAFESRQFEIVKSVPSPAITHAPPPALPFKQIRPVLFIGANEIEVRADASATRWAAGPFQITLTQRRAADPDTQELVFEVKGEPPDADYELCMRFDLPWKRCEWRGDSGGGFVTPGPADKGGDSLLGIAGSIFSAGEGLSAKPRRSKQRIDFALDESGYCGLGQRTTLFARGLYNDAPDSELMSACILHSTETEGRLYWYLLSNQQNYREALLDQAGARHWRFRCGIRQVEGAFDDASLYRFATGFNCEAQIVDVEKIPPAKGWLDVAPASVIVLGARRREDAIEIDLYNTSRQPAQARLRGVCISKGSLTQADMLGFNRKSVKSQTVNLAPLEFVKIIITG